MADEEAVQDVDAAEAAVEAVPEVAPEAVPEVAPEAVPEVAFEQVPVADQVVEGMPAGSAFDQPIAPVNPADVIDTAQAAVGTVGENAFLDSSIGDNADNR